MKVKLSGIRKHPDNPRLIKDADFQSLKKSIILFPEMQTARPIVVNKDNQIIGGNQRFGALKDILSMSLDDISAVIGTSKSPIEPERVKSLIEYWDTFKADKTAEVHKVDWDEVKQKEFMIKDNVSSGEWNFDELANNWDSIELNDWGVGVWSGEPAKEDLSRFFDENIEVGNGNKSKDKIILEYSIEECEKVKTALLKIGKTYEDAVWSLLGL